MVGRRPVSRREARARAPRLLLRRPGTPPAGRQWTRADPASDHAAGSHARVTPPLSARGRPLHRPLLLRHLPVRRDPPRQARHRRGARLVRHRPTSSATAVAAGGRDTKRSSETPPLARYSRGVMRLLGCALIALMTATGCASSTAPTGSRGWSEAGRRARARHAWHCQGQVTSAESSGAARFRRVTPRAPDPGCDPARFLCREIHRGARATVAEREECAAYEAVHGRVSGR